MNECIYLVCVQIPGKEKRRIYKRRIYQTNHNDYFSIGLGDTVIVPADGRAVEGTVLATEMCFDDSREMKMLVAMSGQEWPFGRVLGKVERTFFEYEEEA